jgi:Rod binding domain-containing protein
MNVTAVDNMAIGPKSAEHAPDDRQAKMLRLKKACQQFESLFIYYMLKTMKSSSVEKSSLFGDDFGSDVFGQLFDEGLAEKMALSSPLKIGDMLYKNFEKRVEAENTRSPKSIPEDNRPQITPKPTAPPPKQQIKQPADSLGQLDGIIKEAASEHKVDPHLVKAVILQESGGDPKAVSAKGAKGLMQLMDGTARMLGVSDPFDTRQNIFGGVKYLATLLNKFNGNVRNALAAYNAGPGAVEKYGGIPPYEETQKYVENIVGIFQRLFKSN